jgi:hypothetical protein
MKVIFSLLAFCVTYSFQTCNASAPNPSVPFTQKTADSLFGPGTPEAKNRVLNCQMLINRVWPYPSAQVSPLCDDASTSCLRLSLLYKAAKSSDPTTVAQIKSDLPNAKNDVEMKLMGCAQAIEVTLNNPTSLTDTSGYTTTLGGNPVHSGSLGY